MTEKGSRRLVDAKGEVDMGNPSPPPTKEGLEMAQILKIDFAELAFPNWSRSATGWWKCSDTGDSS